MGPALRSPQVSDCEECGWWRGQQLELSDICTAVRKAVKSTTRVSTVPHNMCGSARHARSTLILKDNSMQATGGERGWLMCRAVQPTAWRPEYVAAGGTVRPTDGQVTNCRGRRAER